MKLFLLFFLIVPLTSFGELKHYKLSDKTGVEFHLPYTMGVHDGVAKLGKGELNLDLLNFNSTNGEFSILIDSITTGNTERDCHTREALGLNYKQSDFPKVHVCNDQHKIPLSGKNAIVFPEILFKITSIRAKVKNELKQQNEEIPIVIEGEWNIHGISHKKTMEMKIIREKDKIRVKGETIFSLKDYNIIVKPAKILFVTIAVKDQAKAIFNILLEPDMAVSN